jgi:hypothetical protein
VWLLQALGLPDSSRKSEEATVMTATTFLLQIIRTARKPRPRQVPGSLIATLLCCFDL